MAAMRKSGISNDGAGLLRGARWLRVACVAAIFAIAIVTNPPVREGADRLALAAIPRIAIREPAVGLLVEPRSGEIALTPPVQEIIEMLRDNDVASYRLSSAVATHEFVRQRIIEGAWPIRHDSNATVEVAYIGSNTTCGEIDRRSFDPNWPIPKRQARFFSGVRGVTLARCP
jgi:hypothetical protein